MVINRREEIITPPVMALTLYLWAGFVCFQWSTWRLTQTDIASKLEALSIQ